MLVLSRYVEEEIVIADRISVKVLGIQGGKVKLGITAPQEIAVHRKEIYDAISKGSESPQQNAATESL